MGFTALARRAILAPALALALAAAVAACSSSSSSSSSSSAPTATSAAASPGGLNGRNRRRLGKRADSLTEAADLEAAAARSS